MIIMICWIIFMIFETKGLITVTLSKWGFHSPICVLCPHVFPWTNHPMTCHYETHLIHVQVFHLDLFMHQSPQIGGPSVHDSWISCIINSRVHHGIFHPRAAPKPANLRPNPHGHPRTPFAGSTGLFNSAGIQNKMDFFTKIYKIDVSDVSAKKVMFVVCLMGMVTGNKKQVAHGIVNYITK